MQYEKNKKTAIKYPDTTYSNSNVQRGTVQYDPTKQDDSIIYLDAKDHQNKISKPQEVRKTITISGAATRGRSPGNDPYKQSTNKADLNNTAKEENSKEYERSPINRDADYILNQSKNSNDNRRTVGNPNNFSNTNILNYMQPPYSNAPFTDHTYSQPGAYDRQSYNPQAFQGQNPNNYGQNTYYSRQQKQGDNFLMDAPMYVQGTHGVQQNTIDPTRLQHFDSNLEERTQPNYQSETYSQNPKMSITNIYSKMSPNRNQDIQEEIIKDNPEIRKKKLEEIKRLQELGVEELNTKPSVGADNVDKMYQEYGGDIDILSKLGAFDNPAFRMRSFSRAFDRTKIEGRLLNNRTIILNEVKMGEGLQNKNGVIKKMKKLSNVLMSKSQEPGKRKDYDEYDDELDMIKAKIRDSKSEPKKRIFTTTSQKFIRVTMAMLSSKGPNCEDRTFTRDMRFEKGGVVDLAQKKNKNDKYKIKKVVGNRSPQGKEKFRYSQRDREKAVKICQAWWRGILGKYQNLLSKIVKIQSFWRSKWIRLNMVDIIYATSLLNTFGNKISQVINRRMKIIGMEQLVKYGNKHVARMYFLLLIKLQKFVKNWLDLLKDKRNRMANLLDKLAERRKRDAFNAIKDSSDNQNIKKEKQQEDLKKFLLKAKKCARVAIFHDMLFSTFNKPINELKSQIFRNSLRGNVRKFHLLFKREYFMRWLKKCLGSGDYKKLSADILVKAILKKPFRDVVKALSQVPPKDLKDRVLRNLISRGDKYNDIALNTYFKKWKGLTGKLRDEELINALNAKLTLKTAKKLQLEHLRSKFRFWRDNVKKAKDIKPYIKGMANLENFVNKAVGEKTMPALRNATKGVQQRATKALLRNNKFHLLPLRHYYAKWKAFNEKQDEIETKMSFLVALKNSSVNRMLKAILLRRLWDWRRKANIMEIKDHHKNDDTKEKKYFAIVQLMNGTTKLAKRKAFSVTKQPIMDYLTDLIRQRATKDLLFMFPKLNRITLRNYFRKWTTINDKIRQKSVRAGFFTSLATNSKSKFRLKFLKRYFDLWYRKRPKNLSLKYYQGAEKLRNGVNRMQIRKPVEAFKDKIILENAKNGIQHAFGLKDKFIKRHWRQYFIKWWKIADQIKAKEEVQQLAMKLVGDKLGAFKKRILFKWFSHWKKTPKINLNDVYQRFKNMAHFVKLTVDKGLLPPKKDFLTRLPTHKSNKFIKACMDKLIEMATQGKTAKLRHYLWRWLTNCKDSEIYELKKKLLMASVSNSKTRTKRNELYHFFNRWRNYNKKCHDDERSGNNFNLYEAVDRINKLAVARKIDFMSRLKRLMNLDHRGLLFLNIKKRLLRPRLKLEAAFNLWHRKIREAQAAEDAKDKTVRLLRASTNKFQDRVNRDNFIKMWYLWKKKASVPDDFYQRVIDGKKKVNNYLKSKLRKPYNELINTKNYQKLLKKALPHSARLAQKEEDKTKLRLWNQWKKYCAAKRMQEHHALLIGKLSDKHLAVREINMKGKYFRKWAGIKKKTLHYPDIVQGVNKVDEVLRRPHRKPFLDNLKKSADEKGKNKAINELLSQSKTFQLKFLRKALLKWWKNTRVDPFESHNKALRTLRKSIIKNYIEGPLQYYMKLWMRSFIVPPKDISKTVQGLDKLKKPITTRATREPFEALKDATKKPAKKQLRNAAKKKIVPNVDKALLRTLGKYFRRWKRKVDDEKVKDAEFKVLTVLMDKGQGAMKRRFIKKYFDLWKNKDKVLEPANIAAAEGLLTKLLAKKHLVPFTPKLAEESKKKFLRSCLNKNSKFHQKAVKPFFDKWRANAIKQKARDANADLAARLINRTAKYKNRKDIQDVLRAKLRLWKVNKDSLKDEHNDKTNEFVEKLKAFNIHLNAKPLFPELKKIAETKVKKKALRSAHKKRRNNDDLKLKAYLWTWRTKKTRLAEKELKEGIATKYLKNWDKNNSKNLLFRYFFKWFGGKELEVPVYNYRPVKIGMENLRKIFERQPWETLKKKTKMMNLKIPDNMSLAHALIRLNPNICKSMALRNINFRPYWKLWKYNVRKMDDLENRDKLFNKIFNLNSLNLNKTGKHIYFRLWKNKADKMREKEDKDKALARWTKSIFGKKLKLWMKKCFRLWKGEVEAEKKKLDDISRAVIILHARTERPHWRDFCKYGHYDPTKVPKMDLVKNKLIETLRKSDKGNLSYLWNRWRVKISKLRELELKYKILKNLASKNDKFTKDRERNQLHEKFLKWRILANPRDVLKAINNVRIGCQLLDKGLIKKYHSDIIPKLKHEARLSKVKEALINLSSDYDNKGKLELLRIKFKLWRIRVGDDDKMKNELKKLADNYIVSPPGLRELVEKPKNDLVDAMKAWSKLKENKAADIKNFAKNMLLILQKMKNMKRSKFLHEKIKSLSKTDFDKLLLKFQLWRSKAKIQSMNLSATVIQRFCKSKLNEVKDKKETLDKAGEYMSNLLKRYAFNNIYATSKSNRLKDILVKCMEDIPEEVKKEYLKKYTLRWWKVVRAEKENEAANIINQKAKQLRSKKKKKELEKKRDTVDTLLKKLYIKCADLKESTLQLWRNKTQRIVQNDSATIIQKFARPNLEKILKTNAEDQIYRIIKKKYISELKKAIAQGSKINGDRSSIMFETLNDIYFRRPFLKLKEASVWINRIGTLRAVFPKLLTMLTKRFCPPKLELWRAATVGERMAEFEKQQSWLRAKQDRENEIKLRARNKTFAKHFQKLDKQLELQKQIKLKLWKKNTKIIEFEGKAEEIQAFQRGAMVRQKLKKEKARQEVKKLFSVLYFRNVANTVKELNDFIKPLKDSVRRILADTENRISNNNMVDLANNTLRNIYLDKLTGKSCFKSNLMLLRFWFNKWRKVGDKMHDNTIKLQSNFRSRKAKQKCASLKRVKDTLLDRALKNCESDQAKVQIALRIWGNKALQLKVIDDGLKIRQFCRQIVLQKARVKKFQKTFVDWSEKVVKTRVLNGAKIDFLRNALRKIQMPTFIERLKNKTKYDKFRLPIIKRFGDLDGELRNLFLKHYLKLWKSQAEKIAKKEEESAVKIQTNLRSAKQRKKIDLVKKKNDKVSKMLFKLWSRMVMKKQRAFRLWSLFTKEDQMIKDATTIQKFAKKVLTQKRDENADTKKNTLENFVNVTMKNIDRAQERPIFKKIQEEIARKKVEKLAALVERKRKDNLKTSVDNIKNYGDMKQEKLHDLSKKIQGAWRNLKWRRHIWDLVQKIQRLRAILKMIVDKDLRTKYQALRLWKKNILIPEILGSAKVIQKFCREKVIKQVNEKKDQSENKLNDLFRRNFIDFHWRPYLRAFVNTVKLGRFKLNIEKYIFKKFRYNVDNSEKIKLLNKLFRLPKKCTDKILRGRIKLWAKTAKAIKENEAAEKIQRNFRKFRNQKKDTDIKEFLDNQLKNLFLRHSDVKKYYLLWWKGQVEKIKQNESATIIQKFSRTEFERIKVKKNWWRLSQNLYRRNKIENGISLLNRYKMFRRIKPLYDRFTFKLWRLGFDNLRDKGRLRKIENLAKSIFENFDKRQDIVNLFKFWKLWRHNNAKLNQRDINLEKMVKAIDNRDKIIQAKAIGDACTVKRLGKLLDTVRSKIAFHNLKWRADNKNKIAKLGELLNKGQQELLKKNEAPIREKLYKLYAYKVLGQMVNKLEKVRNPKLKNIFAKHFLNQLHNNLIADSKDEYKNQKKSLRSGKPKNFNFKGKSNDPEKSALESPYENAKLHAGMATNKIIDDLIKKRQTDALEKMKKHDRNLKFAKKLTDFVKKKVPSQPDFDKLKKGLDLKASSPDNKDKLRHLFALYYIRDLKKNLAEPAKMMKSRYLIRLAFLHKNTNDKRTYLELIRKWKFHVMMNKFLKKKSENMYKQMHVNFLNMMNLMMGDSKPDGMGNGSLYNEVEHLASGMGLYKNVNPNTFYDSPEDEKLRHEKASKYYKFPALEFKKKNNEEENEHVDDEDNPDVFVDAPNNQTQGRFKEDTVRTQK